MFPRACPIHLKCHKANNADRCIAPWLEKDGLSTCKLPLNASAKAVAISRNFSKSRHVDFGNGEVNITWHVHQPTSRSFPPHRHFTALHHIASCFCGKAPSLDQDAQSQLHRHYQWQREAGASRRLSIETIRSVLHRFLNTKGAATDPPVIIIAAKDEPTFKPLLPEAYQVKGATQVAGLYVGGPEKNYVALRLDVSLDQDASAPFETVYHEYVHYVMRRSISVIPLWLTEGLAEFYANLRLDSKYVLLGTPSDSNLRVLRQTPMLPLSTLFAVKRIFAVLHENDKASIFYAESWC